MSLFDSKGLMNVANKPAMKKELFDQPELSECISTNLPDNCHYVIDGGSLVQRIPWSQGITYSEVCQTYIRHLQTNYKFMENVTVVFDGGYLELSTKYTTHIHRNNGRVSKTIIPSSSSSITVKKTNSY